ncbi:MULTISPECIES: SDR family NAD(P)-dependent oxidoreductase [Subtercola]|uniref:SDR family NAD(P)-dependent oxidoreductase n=1 Tax=Subtercola vilae TaxID=2056433 RepID=A0A4T2C0D2_9MICO|nr:MULTISPECIES: SDR family NAD(P)-dependent oxidoreductase [Subtercola]MEA9985276.1 SDR family NAD(P)-dependent oxidoreductase [Subtercola sp. RTI3]TIH35636.1 SDR family NAD(P)-dependent oxidoreductase [Subtercola vilae]
MSTTHWTPARLPSLVGKRFIVTGGTAGLGYWASEFLARRGASVVIAARNEQKATSAIASILSRAPRGDVSWVKLNLANLESVAAAARQLGDSPIDGLIANAGVLGSSDLGYTDDGFEQMFGTNVLGHFALIAQLMPALAATEGSRVVSLGSISHEFFELDLNDLMSEDDYRSFRAYGRSKLAVMLLGFELDRRLRAAGLPTRSLVAHPGFALDGLGASRPGIANARRYDPLRRTALSPFAQGKDAGALPIVRAAADPLAEGGEYWGPDGWRQLKGEPTVVEARNRARDIRTAGVLWSRAETMTGQSLAL